MALRIEADGYKPVTSPWIKKSEGANNLEFKLDTDPGITGRVLTPDGKPAANAVLALAMVQRDAVIEGGALRGFGQPEPEKPGDRWRRPVFAPTDNEGRFRVPNLADATAAVLIAHDSGVREIRFSEFEKAPEIKLGRWGRIDGRVLWQEKAGANENVSLTIHRDDYGYPGVVAQYEKTISDANGNFVFDKVLPGRVQLSRPHTFDKPTKRGTTSVMLPGMTSHVAVKSGDPTRALIGGRGRTIKGRLTGRDAWEGVTIHFHPRAPHVGMPGDNEVWAAWNEFKTSAIGPIFFRSGLKPNADGRFEISGVLPGDYQLFVDGNRGYRQFSVEAESGAAPAEPLDLGAIQVKPAEKKGADARPKKSELLNDDRSAIAVQTENEVRFVLFHRGRLQSAVADKDESDGRWEFSGDVRITGGHAFKVRYSSAEPNVIYLDEKSYRLDKPVAVTSSGAIRIPGGIFVLREEGEPVQLERTLPLRNEAGSRRDREICRARPPPHGRLCRKPARRSDDRLGARPGRPESNPAQ